MTYPRQLLTYHFWNPEEKSKFIEEEYIERKQHSMELLNIIKTIPSFQYSSPPLLHNLPSNHLRSLAGAVGLCSTQFILKYSPTATLLRWAHFKCYSIIFDDKLIEKEGIDKLLLEELFYASFRRGGFFGTIHSANTIHSFSSTTDNNSTTTMMSITQQEEIKKFDQEYLSMKLKSYMLHWLSFSSNVRKSNNEQQTESIILHAIALPEEYLKNISK